MRQVSARRAGILALLSGLVTVAVTMLAAGAATILFALVLPSGTDTGSEAAASRRHTSVEIAWLRMRAATERRNPPAPP
jgi:hypothetical protein